MFEDIMGIVIDTEDKWLNKKLNSHICYKGLPYAPNLPGFNFSGYNFGQPKEEEPKPTLQSNLSVMPSASSIGGESASKRVSAAREKVQGALGDLQGLKDGSRKVGCACGKPKCDCKGYKDGTKHTMGSLAKEIMPTALRMVAPLFGEKSEIKIGAPKNVTSKAEEEYKNSKGYAYGTKMASPMGYYMGDAEVATPQQEQEMMAMAAPQVMQAPAVDDSPSQTTQMLSDTASEAVAGNVEEAIADPIAAKVGSTFGKEIATEGASKALETGAKEAAKNAGLAAAKEGATAGLASGLSSGIAGGAGSLVGDVVSGKGITKEGVGKAVLQAGLTAAMGPIGGFIGGLFKDGTPDVPPMGYNYGTPEVKEKEKEEPQIKRPSIAQSAPQQQGMSLSGMAEQGLLGFFPKFIADDEFRKDTVDFAKKGGVAGALLGLADGSRYAMQAAEKSKMSPEEIQKKFLEERIVAPAKAFLEERPMMSAPLFMVAAAKDFEEGKLPLGKFGGGRLEGGKDRIAYRHKKYGDFEFNPESERVSYKKTFRF